MNRTEAIHTASKSISIHGRGTSWTIIGPYHYGDPSGPYTETTATSHREAVRRAAEWRAGVALALLGKSSEHAQWAIYDARRENTGDVRRLVRIGLAAK